MNMSVEDIGMILKFNNEVRIETSTQCNYACVFCPHSTSFNRKKQIMSFETFKFILDKIKIETPQINHCTISGFGEAFLDKTIMKKIEYARGQDYKVHILTNGSLLSKSIMNKIFRLGVSDLRFSIHALESDKYASIMGTSVDNYIRVLHNIAYAIKNKNNTKIIVTAVIIKYNKDQIKLLIDNYAKLTDLLEIWKPHNWIDSNYYRFGDAVKRTCGRPLKGPLQIQVDGTVNMCCFDYNEQIVLGNFKKQTLSEIFSSEPYLTIKKHHKNGTIP
ncbi:hypothetical protein LCGC14_2684260, partial [marine sediment metagenome]